MKIDIAVVDYGMGNLRSVSKALEHVAPHLNIVVTDQAEQIHAADKVVFPGQGAMPDCMRELELRQLKQAVIQASKQKPFLGICIGLQLLFEHSQEGDAQGLAMLLGINLKSRTWDGIKFIKHASILCGKISKMESVFTMCIATM
jgi:imidazole glycerol-phosphate synthase subunit HisH